MYNVNDLKNFKTPNELYNFAHSVFGKFNPNIEGCPEEALLSGFENACDMIDEGTLDVNDHEAFMKIAYSEFVNMGYDR